MWIRSQNRAVLMNANEVRIVYEDTYCIVCDYYDGEIYYLGEYSTREKALKVLDKIVYFLEFSDIDVFQMPADEDVKV